MLKKIFAFVPHAEVFVRIVYKDFLQNNKYINRFLGVYRKDKKGTKETKTSRITIEELIEEFASLGIKKGDILIIHSSMDGLHDLEASPKDILKKVMQFLGEEGTLVLPTFPYYKEREAPGKVIKYDPKRTMAWTGILPNVFLSMQGTVRSFFPNNTLAANGKYAEEMFKNELADNASHGEHSAWNFCAEHHAKIVFLGVSPSHSLSEIHMAEGILGKNWPIKDWYYQQPYQIRIQNEWYDKRCWVRKSYWTRYVTEEYAVRQLVKAGILTQKTGICRAYISDMGKMKEWLLEKAAEKDLVIYRIPRKHWKN